MGDGRDGRTSDPGSRESDAGPARAPSQPPVPLEWAVASATHPNERESGDHCLVRSAPGGTLLAVVDGLGHGDEAAEAARLATTTMRALVGQPVADIVRQCHNALLGTRGAVATLVWLDWTSATLTWIGVGNVEGLLLRPTAAGQTRREAVMLRGGVIGYQLPPLAASVQRVVPGDTLVLATDGIRDDFSAGITAVHAPVQVLADEILARSGVGSDDALVLVARIMEEPW